MIFKKFLVIGNARHGKDTFAEILNESFGLKYKASSEAALDIFLYDALKDKYNYNSKEECFNDRVNHREEWKQMICDYNTPNKAKLASYIIEHSDCYVGMRDNDELNECIKQNLFELIIWVDASERLELEDTSSFNIDKASAHIIIENNGTLDEFKNKVITVGKLLID